MIKAFCRLLFIFLICSTTGLSAKPLTVGIIDIAPFSFKGFPQRGIHIDFVKEVFRIADIPVALTPLPYPRVVSGLSNGKIDFAIMFKRSNLPNSVEVGKSFGFKNLIVPARDLKVKELLDLRGLRMGVIRNANYGKELNEADYLDKVLLDNYTQSFKMINLNRLESFVISEPAFLYLKKQPEFQSLIFGAPFQLNTRYNHFYAHKDVSSNLIERIRKANETLIKQGFIEKLIYKYLMK